MLPEDREREKPEDFPLSPDLSLAGRVLIEDFLNSATAKGIVGLMAESVEHRLDQNPDLIGHLAGRIFEELAYIHIKQELRKTRPGYLLLSPTETFNLIDSCHPFASRDHYGLTTGINGISIPDGIILQDSQKTWQIRTICEYKAGNENGSDRAMVQLHAFRSPSYIKEILMLLDNRNPGKLLDTIRPTILPKPLQLHPKMTLLYAVPADSSLDLPATKVRLPISKYDLAIFHESFLNQCRQGIPKQ